MNSIFSTPPEIPAASQLDLLGLMFDCSTSDGETLNSTDPPGTTAAIETHSRDPTHTAENHLEILTPSQILANTLYCKSRALASKPKPEINEE